MKNKINLFSDKLKFKFILWHKDKSIQFSDREMMILEKERYVKNITNNNEFDLTEDGLSFIKNNSYWKCETCQQQGVLHCNDVEYCNDMKFIIKT